MADLPFVMKQHDRLPVIRAELSTDLTDASAVRFVMRAADGTSAKVNATATIESVGAAGAGAVVAYHWLAVDTDTAGEFLAEWAVTRTGSLPETYPRANYHTITIVPDLDNL